MTRVAGGGGARRRAGRGPVPAAVLPVLLTLFSRMATADDASAPLPPPPAPAPQGPVERVEVRGSADEAAGMDSTAFATVIRAEDFADRMTSVPELLRDLVGVQVRGLGGEYATVSIRGSSAEQVMVYLDGVPLNRALGGGVNLADLPLGQVESIEVYRGFTPAGLPAASIGGAVLIHTRRAKDSPAATVSTSAGSFGSSEAIASVSSTRGRGDYALGFDGASGRGDFLYFDNNGTPHEPSDDGTTRRANNDFRRGHLSGRLTLRSGPRSRFTLATDLFARDRGVPGLDCCRSPEARYTTWRILVRPELEVPRLLGGRLLARFAADSTWYREEFDDRDGQIGLTGRAVDSINRIGSLGVEAGFVLAATEHQAISVLAARRRETADLKDRALPGPSGLGRAARDSTVVTLEDQISFASDRLVINPSLRYEAYDSSFRPGPAGGLVPSPTGNRYATGKIGFRLRLNDTVALKGNFGRFARLPDFIEMFGDSGSVVGNPSLSPERGRTADLGLTAARRTAGSLHLLQVEATLFETIAEDLIQFIPNPQNTVKAFNLDRARIRGVELTLALGIGPRFNGSLNVTHQVSRDISGRFTGGSLLPGRPQDEFSAGASLDAGRGRVFYDFTYVGRNFLDQPNTPSEALPARYLHDLGWRLRLRPGLLATIEIKNLGDRRTYDYARFPLPGRSYHARLSWTF
jgi:iron complex outermembrane receptor protein